MVNHCVHELCCLIVSVILISTQISGSTMTGEGLAKIGQFIPRLEKVYLDDIFTDSNHLIDRYLFEFHIESFILLMLYLWGNIYIIYFINFNRIKQSNPLQSKWGSSNSDDLLDAWNSVARSIMCCRYDLKNKNNSYRF